MLLHQRSKGHDSWKLQVDPQPNLYIPKTQQFCQQNFGNGWNWVPLPHHMAHEPFWGWYETLLLIVLELKPHLLFDNLLHNILRLALRTHMVQAKTARAKSRNKCINKCKFESTHVKWQIHISNQNSNSCKEKTEIRSTPSLSCHLLFSYLHQILLELYSHCIPVQPW